MERSVALCFAAALILSGVARAQGTPRGFWTVADSNPAHNNVQKAETEITTATVAKDFKLLWKIKLGDKPARALSFSEPLLFPGLISGRGFKDLALWADANTLYAVDSELGELFWKKDFAASSALKACGNMEIAIEAPQVIHFGARKPATAKPAAPAPPRPSDEPLPRSERRVGAAAGGGSYGLKGIYVLTSDGYLHEQIMATGLDYAPPVKFFPRPGSFALNMNEKVIYTVAGSGCRNLPNAVWSIDLNTPAYAVNSYQTRKLSLSGITGPAIGRDGTAYIVTGSGQAMPPVYANSVVALTATGLKVKDWYTPSPSGKAGNASPVAFAYKDRELIAAPRNDGSLVLLDSQSLGGPGHHTPLTQTDKLFASAKRRAWESLATWQDKSGVTWLLASISGPLRPDAKFPGANGPAPHGCIVAFKVEETEGKMSLVPGWISRDLKSPAPPAIANGVVFALEGGDAHATLYALDAASGKQLYSSGNAIAASSHLAGMSIGDGHVFFTTRDNTLYSFGIPLEH